MSNTIRIDQGLRVLQSSIRACQCTMRINHFLSPAFGGHCDTVRPPRAAPTRRYLQTSTIGRERNVSEHASSDANDVMLPIFHELRSSAVESQATTIAENHAPASDGRPQSKRALRILQEAESLHEADIEVNTELASLGGNSTKDPEGKFTIVRPGWQTAGLRPDQVGLLERHRKETAAMSNADLPFDGLPDDLKAGLDQHTSQLLAELEETRSESSLSTSHTQVVGKRPARAAQKEKRLSIEQTLRAAHPSWPLWRIHKEAVRQTIGDEHWEPRKKLSPEAMEGVRALNESYPEHFTMNVIAKQFQVAPEAIRRILKSKWRPNEAEEEDRMRRWERRGERVWQMLADQGMEPPKRWREKGIGAGPRRGRAKVAVGARGNEGAGKAGEQGGDSWMSSLAERL